MSIAKFCHCEEPEENKYPKSSGVLLCFTHNDTRKEEA